jgi:hypothetical protein
MENTELIVEKKKKIRHNTYKTMDYWIEKMREAFSNAIIPEIYPHLLTVGYDEARLAALRQKVKDLIQLSNEQIGAKATKIAATDTHVKKCKEINLLYSKHRALLKVLMGNDTLASTTLQLNVRKKKDYSNWFQEVHHFYTQLTQNTGLATQAATVGITAGELDTQLQRLGTLQTGNENARAQLATELRDKAFAELRKEYAQYIKYAKILMPHDQMLEAIGITVRSRR